MMRFSNYSLLLIFFLPFFSCAQPKNLLEKEIKKIIKYDTEIKYEETPSFSVGIVDQDSVYYQNFSDKKSFKLKKTDQHSLFEIGSLSKPITASLVAQLVAQGKLNFSDPINQYIPEAFRNKNLDDLTIDDLLTHASGLPKLPKGFGLKEKSVNDPYSQYSKKDLLTFYRDFKPLKKKKTTYLYSHVNFALVELVIENAIGKSFEAILKQELFVPAEMNHSGIYDIDLALLSQGYRLSGRAASPMQFKSFAASEGMKSSIEDLTSFMRHILLVENSSLGKNLQINLEKGQKSNLNKSIYSARGWQIIDHKPYDIYFHSGKTNGHAAYMVFVPETKTGVVLLANSEKGTEDLAMLILRMINNNWKRKA